MVYESLPLNPGEIRLIFLKHAAWDVDIEIGLKVVKLAECPPYDALSYTWGKENGHSVTVNQNTSFSVTENLWLALRRLRRLDTPRVLWIDAICIDQGHIQERNVQVGHMYDIYKSASRVIVWLGEPRGSAAASTIESQGSGRADLSISDSRDKPLVRLDCSTNPEYDDLDGVILNSDRFWWNRAWTVQEVLANNNIVVFFGSREIKWIRDDPKHDFVKWVDDYQQEQYQVNPDPDTARMRMLEQLQWIKRLSGKHRSGDYRFPHLADIIMRRSAFDPRDKVFSMLGSMNPLSSALIKPDYALQPWQVFAEATFAVIVGDASFEILRYVSPCRDRLAGLPSWAVDFTVLEQGAKIPRDPMERYEKVKNRDKPRKVSLSTDYKELRATGHILDVVAKVFCLPNPIGRIFEERAPEELTAILDEALVASKMTSLGPIFEAKSKLSVGTQRFRPDGTDQTPLCQMLSDESCISDALIATFRAWEMLRTHISNLDHYPLSSEDWLSANLIATCRYAEDTAGTAVAFSTHRGFIGIAPANAQPNDRVVLMPGGKWPIILGRLGDRYEFRAFSYVHGACDKYTLGELRDVRLHEGLVEEDITLV